MDLTESQRNALLDLGECAAGHEFISERVLKQLLALGLVYWRKYDELDFTPAGEQVYDELTRSAEKAMAD